MISPIVCNKFENLNPSAKFDYENQRKLAITLVVVGIVLCVGVVVALHYARGLTQTYAPAIKASFGILLGLSLVVAFSPMRKDWTPYHTEEFFNRVHQKFQTFNQTERGMMEFKIFLQSFRFDKLRKYYYIKPLVSECCEFCKDACKSKSEDEIRAAIIKWNAFFLQNI